MNDITESIPTLRDKYYSKYKLLKLQSSNLKKRYRTFGGGCRLGGLLISNEPCVWMFFFFNSAQQLLSWTVNYSSHLCLQINNFKAKFYIAIQTEFLKD